MSSLTFEEGGESLGSGRGVDTVIFTNDLTEYSPMNHPSTGWAGALKALMFVQAVAARRLLSFLSAILMVCLSLLTNTG